MSLAPPDVGTSDQTSGVNSENIATPNTSVVEFEGDIVAVGPKEVDPEWFNSERSKFDTGIFEQPLYHSTITWPTGGSFGPISINPWLPLKAEPVFSDRLKHAAAFTGDAVVRFVIVGNPQCYGRGIAAYRPFTAGLGATAFHGVDGLNAQNITLNPSSTGTTDIVCPFYNAAGPYLIPGSPFTLGTVEVSTLSQMQSSSDVAPPALSINVYVYYRNMKLYGTTSMTSGKVASENRPGPITLISSAIASATAMKLTDIPFLGRYATATRIVAQATAEVATLFGFSRPAILPVQDAVVMLHEDNNSILTGKTVSKVLGPDQQAELPVDGATFGFTGGDEMAISNFAARTGVVSYFVVSTTDATGDLRATIPVTPSFVISTSYTPIVNQTRFALTPIAHASLAHTYWRGSLIYRVHAVTNGFTRGRLAIRHCMILADPTDFTVRTPALNNTDPTVILDLSSGEAVDIVVPWRQQRPWGLTSLFHNANQVVNTGSTNTALRAGGGLNGTLLFEVMAPLTTGAVAAKSIAVYVTVRGGDDFELAVPTLVTPFIFNDATPPPAAAVEDNPPVTFTSGREDPFSPSVELPVRLVQLSEPTNHDMANVARIGSASRSIRAILKRYCHYGSFETTANSWKLANLPVFLEPRSSLFVTVGTDNTLMKTSNQVTAAFSQTFYTWFKHSFIGRRGGMRYKAYRQMVGSTTTTSPGDRTLAMYVVKNSRYNVIDTGALQNNYTALADTFYNTSAGYDAPPIGVDGYETSAQNGVLSFTIPDHSVNVYRDDLTATDNNSSATIFIPTNGAQNAAGIQATQVSYAVADDFSFFGYVHPPIIALWDWNL